MKSWIDQTMKRELANPDCKQCSGFGVVQEHKSPCAYSTGQTVSKLCNCPIFDCSCTYPTCPSAKPTCRPLDYSAPRLRTIVKGDPINQILGIEPTSFKTSRNIVPRAHKLAAKLGLVNRAEVLDYGCGRFTKGADYLIDHGAANVARYDPQLPGTESNLQFQAYDLVILANVLNVIPQYEERLAAILKAWHALKPSGQLIIQVYPGDRSGALKRTRDGWQHNKTCFDLAHELIGHLDQYGGYQRHDQIMVLFNR